MAIGEEETAMEKIQISGATLASLLQRFSSSPGDIEGLLFGHVTTLSPSHFSDDATSSPPPPTSIATITSFLTTATATSPPSSTSSIIIGWFSGRRRSPLRPSLRDSLSLSSLSLTASPRVFLLLTSPAPSPNHDNATAIHTHEYKAYQFYRQNNNLVPRTLEAVNIGPGFRNHYGSFSPTSPFPVMTPFENVGFMTDEKNDGMGLDAAVLNSLMGREAGEYTGRVEDVYKGMLERLDQLAMMVHDSSSKVFHQENQNMKLRFKIAGLE